MARLFLLIKRKGAKKFIGAIPARRGISKDKLRKQARQQIKPGLTFSIITERQLKSRFLSLVKRKQRRKPMSRRRKQKRRQKKGKSRKLR